MSKYLPEGFTIPTSQDYNDAVEHLDKDVVQEGGAKFFIPIVRVPRRSSDGYGNFLRLSAINALSLEARDSEGVIIDSEHKRANAIMSGIVMGQLLGEMLYPIQPQNRYKPFAHLHAYAAMLGDSRERYEKAGGKKTVEGWRIGIEAMASTQLDLLSESSLHTLRTWGSDLIPESARVPLHILGVGMALYQDWDWVTDRMREEGIDAELPEIVTEATNHE